MVTRSVIKLISAVVLLTLAACGDDDPEGEEIKRDAAAQDDGGLDASAPDARVDGSRAEAGPLDATVDAAADAQVSDARVDATTPDAGPLDAGVDSGTDSGTDAGTDAGTDSGTDAGRDAGLPALAAWYKFDENTGTSSDDSADHFANATLLNGASWVPGKSGSAVDLAGGLSTGENNYVTIPANVLAECEDATVALWMKLGTVTNWSRLLDIPSSGDAFIFFTPAEAVGNTPHLLFNIYKAEFPQGDPRNDQRVSAAYPAGTTLAGVWHHVAFTLTGGTGRLYFDGQQIGSNAMTRTPADIAIGDGALARVGRSLYFPDPYLDGTIDDLRFSCTAYTAQQIATLAQ